jgi:hypothetical protein
MARSNVVNAAMAKGPVAGGKSALAMSSLAA